MSEQTEGPELSRTLIRKLERYRDFPLESLEAISQVRDVLGEIEIRAIVEARERGATWDDIAEALSISRQSVLYRLRTLAKLPRRGSAGRGSAGRAKAGSGTEDGAAAASSTRETGAEPPLTFRVEERNGEHVLLGLSGELTGHDWTDKLRRFLEERYVDDGVLRIRLDLADVTELDEEGLAALKAVRREAQERHKQLLLEGTRGQLRALLVAEGLDAG